jgi:Aspartyl protease
LVTERLEDLKCALVIPDAGA